MKMAFIIICAALLACGCGDDARDTGTDSDTEADAAAADAGAGDAGDADSGQPPVYVVATTVSISDEVDQGYLVPIESTLDEPTTFDLDHAIEISDSTIAGWPGTPYVYVGASDAPTITRWELRPDGTLHEGKTLSFADFGITRASVGNDLFYAADKAYLPDDANQQLIVWNPRSMEITGTIELPTAADGALVPWTAVAVRRDSVLVSVSWQEDFSGDWSNFGDHVELITIDPKTDAVLDTSTDPRSSYAFWGSLDGKGTAYFSPMSYYAPIRSMLGADRGIASIALRVLPGARAFDPDYAVDLSELVGGRPAGNLFLVSDKVALIRAWHADLVSEVERDKSNWQDVLNEAGFLWWRWPLGSDKAELIEDQEPGASEVTGLYHVDGRTFLPRVSADYSSTTLDELTEDGAFRPILTGPGNLWGIIRAR
jgi:hypothetical protein